MSTSQLDETGRNLMLRAMISMAAADGDVAQVETAMVSGIFEQVTGGQADMAEIVAAAAGLQASQGDIAADLADAAAGLDDTVKDGIVRAAYLVLLADGKVQDPERQRLYDIAAALGLPETHVTAILDAQAD